RHVGFENARIVGGAFRSGRRVEIAAHRFDFFRNLPRAAPPRALEGHMFEKMGNTVLVVVLVTAAGRHPDPERGGLETGHRIGHDVDAGFRGGPLDAHAAAPSWAARLVAKINRSTADWSAGSAVTRSGRSLICASQSGSAGRMPHAAS